MTVIGTPVLPPSPPSPTCVPTQRCYEINAVAPDVSRYYDSLLLTRMRSVSVQCGQKVRIRWTVVNSQGFAVDLTDCDVPADFSSSVSLSSSAAAGGTGFRFRIRENLSLGVKPAPQQTEFDVYVIDAENGVVEIELTAKATGLPGVYFGELAVCANFDTADEIVLFTNMFYVLMQRGQYGADDAMFGGPPTIQEIRLHLRDSSPGENLLLDNLKFDDAEIALAISRPIQYWNEIPPDLNCRYTTQNFPWRYHWLEGICANLFWMAAEQFRANNLKYSAAGVQVDDQNKQPDYEQAAQRRDAEWKNFVRRKKSELNLNAAFGGIGSPYARY